MMIAIALIGWLAYLASKRNFKSIGNTKQETQIKQAQEAFFSSERRYSTLAKIAPVGIFHTSATGDCLYVNEQWCEIAGISSQQALGNGWANAIHPEDRGS